MLRFDWLLFSSWLKAAFESNGVSKPAASVPAPRENRPLQLVSTGNKEDDYSFTLCEDNLDRVLSKVMCPLTHTHTTPPAPGGVRVVVMAVLVSTSLLGVFVLFLFLRQLWRIGQTGCFSALQAARSKLFSYDTPKITTERSFVLLSVCPFVGLSCGRSVGR